MPPVMKPVVPDLIGFDALSALARVVRHVVHNNMMHYGVADFLTHFAPEDRSVRDWWKHEKARLIKRDPELVQILHQLKMTAPDGKQRKTEAAPLWACLYIVLLIDTPKANEFKKQLAKSMALSVEQVKYRAFNVSKGMEWAADTNHDAMKTLKPIPDSELKYWEK